MLDLRTIMIGTDNLQAMAEFYGKVFDKPEDMSEGGMHGWVSNNNFLGIMEHSEVHGSAKEPQRLIFSFETKEVESEFNRLKEAGATVIKEPYQMGPAWIATLADPDGNYFQLVTPWEDMNM